MTTRWMPSCAITKSKVLATTNPTSSSVTLTEPFASPRNIEGIAKPKRAIT